MSVRRCSGDRKSSPVDRPGGRGLRWRRAFSLIELLTVIAIIAILAAMLLPVLSTAKAKSKRVVCANQLKQLALGVQMYAPDNDGKLPQNNPQNQGTNTWVLGNMKSALDATNQTLIRLGKLFPYVSDTAIYHCPADSSQINGVPRARSFSMNGWMGSRYMARETGNAAFRTFVRDSEVAAAGAASLWLIMDEHERSLDDSWFLVTMDDSRPFESLPALRHERGAGINFGDGHVETFKLRDPLSARLGSQVEITSPKNTDWIRLKQVTTVR